MSTEPPKFEEKMEDDTFSSIARLDVRILRALADQSFAKPTLVQAKAIPLALEGKDILCRAKTGSGKTVAYCVPVLQRVLVARKVDGNSDEKQTTRALILVPTRELAEQVTAQMKKLSKYCEEVNVINIASGGTNHWNKMILSDRPDIIIGTPARVLGLLQSKSLSLSALEILVIDEADLILSYGHAQTMHTLLSSAASSFPSTESVSTPGPSTAQPKGQGYLPSVYQSLLMSATLTTDVKTLKSLILRSPAILTLTEEEAGSSHSLLSQYVIHLPTEGDKFHHIYVILKLKMIKGKAILFVNDVERCYRLKLFLEQFSIRACVLNKELPINSRYHTIQEFNRGVYDYIIATDETGGMTEEHDSDEEIKTEDVEGDEKVDQNVNTQRTTEDEHLCGSPPSLKKAKKRTREEYEAMDTTEDHSIDQQVDGEDGSKLSTNKKKSKKTSRTNDKEYSTSRGVDFVDVACVVNFDLPLSHRSYVHRVGRTARAGRGGVAINFVVSSPEKERHKGLGKSKKEERIDEERIWSKIERKQNGWSKKAATAPEGERPESCIKVFTLAPSLLAGFKYRMEDALRSVTGKAVKEARIKELKTEVLNSGKLKAHFEDHPLDLEYLRHDKPLHPARVQSHMKYVPFYLLPKGVAASSRSGIAPNEGATENAESRLDGAISSGVISKEMNGDTAFVPFNKRGRGRGRGRGGNSFRGRGSGSRYGGKRKSDPLRKFGA